MNHIIVFLAVVYFLPTVIASLGRRRNRSAIFALNLLLGWSVLGWIIALVWSLMRDPPTAQVMVAPPPAPPVQQIPRYVLPPSQFARRRGAR